MNREYIRLPKTTLLPEGSRKKRVKNDSFWINLIHFHLLKFYKEFEFDELMMLIDTEKKKTKRKHIEDLIKDYIYKWFEKNDRRIFFEGIVINLESKVKYNQTGFYDIKFQHSDWVDIEKEKLKYYSVECKNLDSKSISIDEYIYNKSKKDGGVYRHFNGKYAQFNGYGGMLGFVIDGDIDKIKNSIISKLYIPTDLSPEGDLTKDGIESNSIEGNTFTFTSKHKRKGDEFILHHLLFKLYKS
jgi:hypothetical protein